MQIHIVTKKRLIYIYVYIYVAYKSIFINDRAKSD